MGNLTSTLSVTLKDGVTGPAGKAAGALNKLGASGKDLAKLGAASPEVGRLTKQLDDLSAKAAKIAAFREASRGLGEASASFKLARQEAARLAADLEKAKAKAESLKGVRGAEDGRRAAEADVRKLERALRDATGAVERSKSAFVEQGQAVRGLRSGLTAAGVPLNALKATEEGLAASIAHANAQLARQPALIARAASGARDMTRAMSEAGRRTSDAIASNRRLLDGMGAPARLSATAASAATARASEAHATAREARRAARREAAGVLGAGAAVKAAGTAKRIGSDAITSAADFDIATRKQKVFTDIGDDDQAVLLDQAKKIGQETQFSNIDVVKAQTAAMQGLPASFAPKLKAQVAEGIVENVRNYATLMETDLKEGSETIRSYLQASGKDISTKEKALNEANRATNQIVKMAKLGGMNGEDAAQFVKYAAAPGTSSGLSTDTMLSLGALARRGGLRGDEAGVFMRSTASKLVSPTSKGHEALNAAGINYKNYVTMPDQISTEGLEASFQRRIGKSFTPAVRKKIEALNGDADLIKDQGKYTAAVVDALDPILGKTKQGKTSVVAANKAAKVVGSFHNVSTKSVDAERLLDDIMSSNMTLPQLNAFLTDKHGGKGAITARQWDEFKASRQQIKATGDDPNFARDKAKEVMAGVGGAWENMKGSFENFTLQVGKANEGLIKFAADGIGNAVDSFSKLSATSQQALSLGAGGTAIAAGAWGTFKLASALLGIGGGSAALTTSAVALDASAAALTAAAARLGVAGAASAVPAAAAGAGAGAAGGVTAGAVLGAGVLASGVAAGVAADSATPGTNAGIVGAVTGQESSLQQTMRVLREERVAQEALGPIGPGSLGGGRKVALPGGGTSTAYTSEIPRSRGAVGDFLFGQDKQSVALPQAQAVPTPAAPVAPVAAQAAPAAPAPVAPVAAQAAPAAPAPVAPVAAQAAPAAVPVPDASKIAEATAALASYRAELSSIKADLSTAAEMPGVGAGLEARKAELESLISDAQSKLQALGATSIAPTVDASAIEGLGTKAGEAQAKLGELSGVSIAPSVDSSGLDALISKGERGIAVMQRLKAAAGEASAAAARVSTAGGSAGAGTGSVRRALGNSFAE